MDTTEDIPRFGYVTCAALTDVGRKRKNNEDNYGTFPDAGVFCVADGMGGARDGEVASRIVVEHLVGALGNWSKISPPVAMEDRLALVDKCLDAASLWINQYAATHDAAGCGTTFVGVVLDPGRPGRAVAMHAGDSRLYRIHRRKIIQITRDHSIANMTGVKNEAELNPVFRNMILRAVGIKTAVELERTPFELAEGDWVLICSDGLTKMVDDKAIAKIIAAASDAKGAARTLIAEANRCGGRDNITVVLLQIGPLPPALPVHARLTDAEFNICLGMGGPEPGSTTETAFTEPTGSSAPSALNAVPIGDGAADGNWLSDEDDSDDSPAPLAVAAADDGKTTEDVQTEDTKTTEDVPAPAAPAEDTKTTEDVPALAAPAEDTKTTEEIPPPAVPAEDTKTTEEIPPSGAAPAGSTATPRIRSVRRKTHVFALVFAAVLLSAGAGIGLRLFKNAAEEARLAAIEREEARKAEEARLAAIEEATGEFQSAAQAALAPLGKLPDEIATSDNPESYASWTTDAKASLDAAWGTAQRAGVTNEAPYVAKLGTYTTLSNKVAAAIADRRQALRKAWALKEAEKAFSAEAEKVLAPLLNLSAEIERSDKPESYALRTTAAKAALDAAWGTAQRAGVTNAAPYAAKLGTYTTLSNQVAVAIAGRRQAIDEAARKAEEARRAAEYDRYEAACEKLAKTAVTDAATYREALAAIGEAEGKLPQPAPASPWKAKYDGLRKKYGDMKASISAPTAKIEVKNAGDVALAVTMGDKTETLGKGKSRTFDKLAVWTDYTVSAVARPEAAPSGSAGFQPAAADYALAPAESTAATKGPDTTVTVSFSAKYRGDPVLSVKNDNEIAISVNGVVLDPGKTYTTNGSPRTRITLTYACDNAEYVFDANAKASVDVPLGDGGTTTKHQAARLVKKTKPEIVANAQPVEPEHPVSQVPQVDAAVSVNPGDFNLDFKTLNNYFTTRTDKNKGRYTGKESSAVQDTVWKSVKAVLPAMRAFKNGQRGIVSDQQRKDFEFAVKRLRDENHFDLTDEQKKLLKEAGW